MSLRAQTFARAAFLAVLPLLALPARAAWPPPASATPAQLADPANWPDDPDYAQAWHLFGFAPAAVAASLSERERAAGVGMAVDAAFATTRGAPQVVIALLSTGVRWDDPELVTRYALSRGELPPPQDAGGQISTAADPHDLNGDGRFDVRDWAEDPRLAARADGGDVNGNGLLDPQDLLALFADGVDDDGNGLVDDVCGWDFAGADADAEDPAADSPGARFARLLSAEADNGIGGAGTCPDCPLLPLRISAGTAPAVPTVLARALRFAADAGVAVAALPGTVAQRSDRVVTALDHARDAGLLVVAAAHPPGRDHEALPPHPAVLLVARIGPDPAQATFLSPGDCGAAPPWVDALAAAPGCAAEAAATAAGVAGLVRSAAPASLSADALFHILRQDALPPDPAAPQRLATGKGRLAAAPAVARAAAGIVPARLVPLSPFHRSRHPPHLPVAVAVEVLPATAAVTLHVARGRDPAEADFVPLAAAFVPDDLAGDEFDFTLRARTTHQGVTSERRWQLAAHPSAGLMAGFPRGGATGSPRLVDVTGDGEDELVFAGRDGRVHAIDARGLPLAGFPLDLGEATLVSAIAAADLTGVGRRDLIAGSLEGHLHALRADGVPLFTAAVEGGLRAPPVVTGSLFGPLVIAVGQTGLLHAFGSSGAPLAGTPFQLPFAEVVHPPAAADLDGDLQPELVVVGRGPDGVQRALLLHLRAAGGVEIRAGWPVEADATGAPVLADLAGRSELQVILPVRGGPPRILDLEGRPVIDLVWSPEGATATPAADLALGDLHRNRRLILAGPMGAQTALWPAGAQLLAGNDPRPPVPGADAWSEGTGAAVADVDGDGRPDVLFGSGGALAAVGRSGLPAAGFPQAVGDALHGAPSVGAMLDRLSIAAVTRDGQLYLFAAAGLAEDIQWDGAHHDPAHTGYFGTPLPGRFVSSIGAEEPPEPDEGCGCAGSPTAPLLSALPILLALLSRRRPGARA